MRLFTAITLPTEVKSVLGAAARRIESTAECGNFSRPGNYHVTLVFLGETNKDRISEIEKVIEKTSSLSPPLFLSCAGVGQFKKKNRKILYFKIGGNTGTLSELQSLLYEDFYKRGLCGAQDGYTPHITFARQVKASSLPEIKQSINFASGEITLMHSTRIDGKLTYIPIYSSPFSGTFTVDRIEEGLAVCEATKGVMFNLNKDFLPKGISSGIKIRYNGLSFSLDKKETKNKTDEIRDKFIKEIRKP